MRNIFWGSIPFVLICGIVVYYLASSSVKAKFEARKTELETSKTSMATISGEAKHPNDHTIAEIDKMSEDLRNRVLISWVALAKNQKERNQWPKELGTEFRRMIEKLKPGDEIPFQYREQYYWFIRNAIPGMLDSVNARKPQRLKTKFNEELRKFEPVKDENGNDIWEDIFPKWGIDPPLILNTPGATGGGSPGSMPGGPNPAGGGLNPGSGMITTGSTMPGAQGGGMPSPSTPGAGPSSPGSSSPGGGTGAPSVASSDIVLSEDIRWVGSVNYPTPEILQLYPQGVSDSIQVWYMQENLWAYGALFSVIERTNRDSTNGEADVKETLYRSPIKEIRTLSIGRNAVMEMAAVGLVKGILPNMGSGSSSSDSSSSSLSAGSDPLMGLGGSGGPGGSSGSGTGSDPTAVDAGGLKKISTDALKKAILFRRYVDADMKPLTDTDPPPFEQFNRMPVVMRMIVEQRRIPDVLANCANCDMPIDVLHMRINPGKGSPVYRPLIAGAVPGGPSSSDSSSSSSSGGVGLGDWTTSSGPGGMSGGSGSSIGAGPTQSSGGAAGAESGASGFMVSGGVGDYTSEAILLEIYGIINIFNSPEYSDLNAAKEAAEAKALADAAATVPNLSTGLPAGTESTPADDTTTPVQPDSDAILPEDTVPVTPDDSTQPDDTTTPEDIENTLEPV